MIKSVVIEDEIGAQKVLTSMLETCNTPVQVQAVAGNVAEGIDAIQKYKPDLVFLDIMLPDGDGFQVLDACKDIKFEVIFTTAYGEYRAKAFDNFALQYLTKPIDIDKLEETLNVYSKRGENSFDQEKYALLKKMVSSNLKKIALPTHDGYSLVAIDDIIRCEAQSNYTNIYLNNGKKHIVSKSLKYYDEFLSEFSFYRIHKSHLINTNHLQEVKQDGTVVMSDGSKLSISQRAKSGFLRFLDMLS